MIKSQQFIKNNIRSKSYHLYSHLFGILHFLIILKVSLSILLTSFSGQKFDLHQDNNTYSSYQVFLMRNSQLPESILKLPPLLTIPEPPSIPKIPDQEPHVATPKISPLWNLSQSEVSHSGQKLQTTLVI